MEENVEQPFKQPVVQPIPQDHQDSNLGKIGLMEEVTFSKQVETVVFPVHEYWFGIGRLDDFGKANCEFLKVDK